MKRLSTKSHGMLDYIVGILLAASPWLLGFANGGAEQWVPFTLGALTIVYSFFTRYELGVVRMIPMSAHLGLDLVSGIFLAASPWLFDFANQVYLPHLVAGIFEIFVVMISSSKTGALSDPTGIHGRTPAHS